VLAVAYDLKVFFTVVGKSPKRVGAADVLAFMTAQLSGRRSISEPPLQALDDRGRCVHSDAAAPALERV